MESIRAEQLVPRIYEHCDRWCEHCHATGRCGLFRPGQLDAREPAPGGDRELLPDRLVTRALDALRAARGWLQSHARELAAPGSGNVTGITGDAGRALATIGWYSSQVPQRIDGALRSLSEASIHQVIGERAASRARFEDAHLGMKLVLVSLDRLVAAWRSLSTTPVARLPIDATIEELVTLRGACEERMPGARAFHRPGLDEEAAGSAGAAKPESAGTMTRTAVTSTGDAPPLTRAAPAETPAGTGGEAPPSMSPREQELLEDLRDMRRTLARERGVPAYRIFTNRTLDELVLRRPSTAGGLAAIYGIGERRRDEIGVVLLERMRVTCQRLELAMDIPPDETGSSPPSSPDEPRAASPAAA